VLLRSSENNKTPFGRDLIPISKPSKWKPTPCRFKGEDPNRRFHCETM